jgi:hypothetical protein
MSSSHNARPRVAEVLIRADGTSELVRRRESIDDLLALFRVNAQDTGPLDPFVERRVE